MFKLSRQYQSAEIRRKRAGIEWTNSDLLIYNNYNDGVNMWLYLTSIASNLVFHIPVEVIIV